jgi:adenosylcobyric acid synthase
MAGTAWAREYQNWKPRLLGAVLESFAHLRSEADLVIVEGAGSASEVNLRAHDIANMGFSRAAGVPVVLVGDIDRGGVIASLVGTQAVIDPNDAKMICGFIVNRFRGDPALFEDGLRIVAERTGWAPLGLVPFFADAAKLPAEDALDLRFDHRQDGRGLPRIAVPVTPRIANFDDLDPLRQEPGLDLVLVEPGRPLPQADLVLLPGSKATIDDLLFLQQQGWDIDLKAHVRKGGKVLGICGGYQMLGTRIDDPHGIEGPARSVPGLGFLEVATVMTPEKRLELVSGVTLADGAPFKGYEMHIGETSGPDTVRPWGRLSDGRLDGAVSANGRVAGTYLHGLFAHDRQRAARLADLGAASTTAYEASVEATLDALADHLAMHVDCEQILALSR